MGIVWWPWSPGIYPMVDGGYLVPDILVLVQGECQATLAAAHSQEF